MEAAQAALRAVEQRRDALLREAKAALGLWSGEGGRRRETVSPGWHCNSAGVACVHGISCRRCTCCDLLNIC